MNKHFFNAVLFSTCLASALWTASCSDDDGYPDVDGANPTMDLTTDHIQTAAGRTLTLKGTLSDKDGISAIKLECADLNLNKTIDLIEIYQKPLETYDLSYDFKIQSDEIGENFTIKVTVIDVGGRTTSQDVLVTMDGDFENPSFTVAPDASVTVLIKAETKFSLNFTVTDDRALDYVKVEVNNASGESLTGYPATLNASGQASYTYSSKIILPSVANVYDVKLTAVDKVGNETSYTSTITVSEMPDFDKMYLADVATAAELNSDVFGVPMLINHTDAYQYRARYYNEKAGTEIYFLPQKTDFTPICFGLDPDDSSKLTDDPETAKPIVLSQAGVYYEIDLNVKEGTYTTRTYSVSEATDPIKYDKYGAGSNNYDRWGDGGSSLIDFYIGFGGSPADAGNHLFVQDANNKHLYTYPANGEKWSVTAGEQMNFIITNYHPDGWWDNVEWRVDNSTEPEKFGYFSKGGNVNPNWEGTNKMWSDGTDVTDVWAKPTPKISGNYRFVFDAHLGRGKMVPAN